MSKIPTIHQPHDKLFKIAFGNKEVLQDFLKSRLTPEILAKVDLSTAKLENCSFIAEEMIGTQSDIVYSVQINNRKGYIYTLIEHQSESDDDQPLRLLGYNLQLWWQHSKQYKGEKYSAIINLVLYTGDKPYDGAPSIAEAFEDPQLFYKSLGTPFLIDIRDESDNKILKDGKAALAEFLLRQGKIREFCKFLEENPHIVALLYKSSYIMGALLYMFARDNHPPKEVLKRLPNLDSKTKHKLMSGLQRMMSQSMQEGMQEGIQKGMQKGEEKGILLGRKEGIQLGEKRGIQLGEKRGIQLGEKRGIQLGKERGIMELVKAGIITKSQAEKALESK